MQSVVVFGGGGFIGRRLAKYLVEGGYHVVIPTRKREAIKQDLIVLPNTDLVSCNPADSQAIAKLVASADIVINLVGILHETRRHKFENVHVEFVRMLTDAISQSDNVKQMIHVSSLNAMTGAPSRYLRTKGKGEVFVTKLGRARWSIVRPSVVFGKGDLFIGMFAKMMGLAPVLLLPAANASFQPIWVDDLARMIVACIHNPHCFGKVLSAGGPDKLTLAQIIALIGELRRRRCKVIRAGPGMSRLMATVMESIPFLPPLLTQDNLASMKVPSTCESGNDAKELAGAPLLSLRDYLATAGEDLAATIRYNEYRHVARRD